MDLVRGLGGLLVAMAGAALVFRLLADWTLLERLLERAGALLRRLRREPEAPDGRPIEAIALDARRLSHRFELSDYQRISFAKYEGLRQAYDKVLGEACDALGIEHLLNVLPAGHECDLERLRVEFLLGQRGLRLDDDAA
ncbi:hypothetical protein [Nocardioides sp.]|uniref:hypothetical protein n=1 Tax=Nocardioides sp. TaxID=35761 RepID=UPI003D09DCD4